MTTAPSIPDAVAGAIPSTIPVIAPVSSVSARSGLGPRWLVYIHRAVALGLGLLHTAMAIRAQSMNEDGINYLDMGRAFVRGDWANAINAIWSPLYAWILGVVVHLTAPSVWWEFPTVQLTNFALFVVSLVGFEFFWRQLTERYVARLAASPLQAGFPLPLWTTIGYSLFTWSSLNLVEVWAVTPDMLVAATVYLAAGLLLRSHTAGSRSALVLLGVVLGVGYLAKGAMLPLGAVCIVLAALTAPSGIRLRALATCTFAFILLAAPLIGVLSARAGSLTFGDVGRFTYIKHVNELRYPHWEESIANVGGTPLHPPRRIGAEPAVFEFASPIGGSYPLSFDPGYWTAGLSPHIDVPQQVRALLTNGYFYFDLFVRTQGPFTALAMLLVVIAATWRVRPFGLSTDSALVLWSLAAFGLYALVFVAGRYVAPFVVLFWTGVLTHVRLPESPASRRLLTIAGAALAASVWLNIVAVNIDGALSVLGYSVQLPADAPSDPPAAARPMRAAQPPEIAEALSRAGLAQGDRVAYIGYSFSAFWARLARVQIVAEIPPHAAEAFWTASVERRSEVLSALAGTGARALIVEPDGTNRVLPGSVAAGGTGYLIYFFGR